MESVNDVNEAKGILEKLDLLELISKAKAEWKLEKVFPSPTGGLLMDLIKNNLTMIIIFIIIVSFIPAVLEYIKHKRKIILKK